MRNQKISKILVAIIMTSMLIAILPTLPVSATTLTGITPVSGNVGTVVRVVGTIDTQGGSYAIYFDTNDDGNALNDGGAVKTGNAPANSYAVNDTFTVPPCLGSDAGNGHLVVLRDEQTLSAQSTSFAVITKWTMAPNMPHYQEGDNVSLTLSVTGGTLANTLNNFTVGVTNPAGVAHMDYNFSFTTDAVGSGSVTRDYPTTFATGASSVWTGTYTVSANRTAPGIITNAVSASFTVGLTDKLSYGRFETVNVQTAGWTPGQNITIMIKNPSGQNVTVWNSVNATTGTVVGSWVIPWNATMGTYSIQAVNVTGSNKVVASMHTFEIGSAALTVTITAQPAISYQRTNIVSTSFTIQYPDSSYYTNTTQFSSITISAYYNSTMFAQVPLTAANFNSATNEWTFSWKIPRNATAGSGYKFTLAKDSITDIYANHGPTSAVSTTAFTVTPATLMVMLTQQPAANYTRTVAAMAKMNITYPDNTFFTDADLGTVTVSINQGATSVANFTLAASAYNSTTKQWTISWVSGFNSTIANDYLIWVRANNVKDASNNAGPTAPVIANAFEMLTVKPTIAAIGTAASEYNRGEFVQIFFDAKYADGTPVTTGTSTITVVAPDGFSATTLNPVHTTNGRWAVTWWASDASQIGTYSVRLAANALVDGALPANMGPNALRTANFTILPAEVTLQDIIDAIDALDDRISAVESDTNSLQGDTSSIKSQVTTLYNTVGDLADVLADLQTQVDALQATAATAATKSEVAAVSSAVSSLNTAVSSLESKVGALQSALNNAATKSDVNAVNSSVDEVNADIAALQNQLDSVKSDLNAAIGNAATPAEVDATVNDAVSDLNDSISGINTLVIVAIVLALIAAAAAIAAVFIIQRKIAG
jgi:archaellum component FlaC